MKIPSMKKTYAGRTVLALPEFEIPDGSVVAVIGANGSGKSTFAKLLSGQLKSDSGLISGDFGQVGFLPQKSIAFRMTLKKNILLNGKDEEKAEKLMAELNLLALADSRAQKLSGGETAKMALARILMRHYDLLILDEPSASMDMKSTLISEQLIKNYCTEENSTVVLITHSIQQARRIADHVLFLMEGSIIETGAASQVLYSPERKETVDFLNFYGAGPL